MKENIIVIRDPLVKNVEENLKHDTQLIIKGNESLAKNKIKNKTQQLLFKY